METEVKPREVRIVGGFEVKLVGGPFDGQMICIGEPLYTPWLKMLFRERCSSIVKCADYRIHYVPVNKIETPEDESWMLATLTFEGKFIGESNAA